MRHLVVAAIVSLLLASCATVAPDQPPVARPADPLVARLVQGGYVVYFRHGKTDGSLQDKQDKPEWWKSCDSKTHRPLSDAGRAQMLAIGGHIRALRIPVASVVTSEYCRAVDSGLLLQLMPLEQNPALNYADAQRFVKRSDVTIASDMRTLFSTVPPAGKNTILVAHVHGINPALDPVFSQMQEAEAVVMLPKGEGKFEIVGRIPAERWALRQPK